MSYEKTLLFIKIMIYALSSAFFVKNGFMPALKSTWKKRFYKHCDMLPRWILNPVKPFECMGCMTWWFGIIYGLQYGFHFESFCVGIIGFTLGSIAEGILMKWL